MQKGAEGCLDISPEKIQMAKKPVTRCSTSLVREMPPHTQSEGYCKYMYTGIPVCVCVCVKTK